MWCNQSGPNCDSMLCVFVTFFNTFKILYFKNTFNCIILFYIVAKENEIFCNNKCDNMVFIIQGDSWILFFKMLITPSIFDLSL